MAEQDDNRRGARTHSKRHVSRRDVEAMARQASQEFAANGGDASGEDGGDGGSGVHSAASFADEQRGGSERSLNRLRTVDVAAEPLVAERPSTMSHLRSHGSISERYVVDDNSTNSFDKLKPRRTASFKAAQPKLAISRVVEPLPSPASSTASPSAGTLGSISPGSNTHGGEGGEHWAPLIALEALCSHLGTKGYELVKELQQEKYLAPNGSTSANSPQSSGILGTPASGRSIYVVDITNGDGMSSQVHKFISDLCTLDPATVDKFRSFDSGMAAAASHEQQSQLDALLAQEFGSLLDDASIELILESIETLALGIPLVPPAVRRDLIEKFESAEMAGTVARGASISSYELIAPLLYQRLARAHRRCLSRLCAAIREATLGKHGATTTTTTTSRSMKDAAVTREIAADWLARVLLLGQPKGATVKSFRAASVSKSVMGLVLEYFGTDAVLSPVSNSSGRQTAAAAASESTSGAHKKRHGFRRMFHTIKHKFKGDKESEHHDSSSSASFKQNTLPSSSGMPVVLRNSDGDIAFLSHDQYSEMLSSKAQTFPELIRQFGRPPPPAPTVPEPEKPDNFGAPIASHSLTATGRKSSGSVDNSDDRKDSRVNNPQATRFGRRRRSLSLSDAEAIKSSTGTSTDEDDGFDLL